MEPVEDRIVLSLLHKLQEEEKKGDFEPILRDLIREGSQQFWNGVQKQTTSENAESVFSILLLLLSNQFNLTRIWARFALSQMGEKALPELIQAVNHRDPEIGLEAMTLLSHYFAQSDTNTQAFLEALIEALSSKYAIVRAKAITALSQMKGKQGTDLPFPLLLQLLDDENTLVRKWASLVVSQIDKIHFPELLQCLSSSSDSVRIEALKILSLRPSEDLPSNVVALLLPLLTKKQDKKLQLDLIEIFGRIGPKTPEVIPELLKRFEDPKEDMALRNRIARTFGKMGTCAKEAIPALQNTLTEKKLKIVSTVALSQIEGIEDTKAKLLLDVLAENPEEAEKKELHHFFFELGPTFLPFILKYSQESNQIALEKITLKWFDTLLESLKNSATAEKAAQDLETMTSQLLEAIIENENLYPFAAGLLKEFVQLLTHTLNKNGNNATSQLKNIILQLLQKLAEAEKRKPPGKNTGKTRKYDLKEQLSRLREVVQKENLS